MKKKTFDYALRSAWQAVSKMYNKEASKFDSTMAMGFTLLTVEPEGTPSTMLGPKMGMEPTGLSRLLKSMEARGLIYRRQHPKDKRSILIHLTDFGKQKRDDSKAVVLHFNDFVARQIGPLKMKHFFEVATCIKECANLFEYFKLENNTEKSPSLTT